MKLYLIRHTSVNVPQGICYGQTDVALKDSFEVEAERVLQQIKAISFDEVYTSPLSRCVKLADYCGFTQAILDDRLQELNFGHWEMQRWDDINDPHLAYWYDHWLTASATGGESFNDLYDRFLAFMGELPTSMKQVALFTHGGIVNCARVYAGVATVNHVFNDTPCYGSVTVLDLFPDDLKKD